MERDSSSPSRFARCLSPSCFPLGDETEYHRLRSRDNRGRRSTRKWRDLLKRIVADGKCIYRPKRVSFHYDAVSYSQNFDEGRWRCEYGSDCRCGGCSRKLSDERKEQENAIVRPRVQALLSGCLSLGSFHLVLACFWPVSSLKRKQGEEMSGKRPRLDSLTTKSDGQ
ncbi:hypothetical protein NL676_013788 [Syzygium grande]|nr:hypothetical protein NL676_013788 [Syzygium grande]